MRFGFQELNRGARGRARGPGAGAWQAYTAAAVDYRFRRPVHGFCCINSWGPFIYKKLRQDGKSPCREP